MMWPRRRPRLGHSISRPAQQVVIGRCVWWRWPRQARPKRIQQSPGDELTYRVALIGRPLRRPHSGIMHNAAFEHFSIDAKYELFELDPGQLDEFIAEVRRGPWLGFQVTAPYKQEIMSRCDAVEPDARQIGAVNSVVCREDGSLLGFNTDAGGFLRSVHDDLGRNLEGATVVIAGAGGAARAVAHACLTDLATSVIIGARSVESARSLVDQLQDSRLEAVELGQPFVKGMSSADLAVNATTVGMTSLGMAFDPAELPNTAAVFDLVYVPPTTELVRRAEENNLQVVNGLGMLVSQAEIAFERWTGIARAGDVMRHALETEDLGDEA